MHNICTVYKHTHSHARELRHGSNGTKWHESYQWYLYGCVCSVFCVVVCVRRLRKENGIKMANGVRDVWWSSNAVRCSAQFSGGGEITEILFNTLKYCIE